MKILTFRGSDDYKDQILNLPKQARECMGGGRGEER